ncbi:hypothetical protein HY500_00190 [Candidatus Woesearchaeota archaeon]|nr:hypothetical protein [Candidatus Woesearchaeota archaeon]
MEKFKELDKTVIKIAGNAKKLLLDISTNENVDGKNALLDRFGKLVVLFDQTFVDNGCYIVFEKEFNQRFYAHTNSLIKLSGCKVEVPRLKIFHVFSETQFNGVRTSQRAGYLLLSEERLDLLELSDEEYKVLLVENNISRQGVDFDQEMFLNLNWQEAVSFTKGCYTGQEIIARVHNLGKPPLRLVRVLTDEFVEDVFIENKKFKITSCVYSGKYKSYIGFSLIPNREVVLDDGRII